MADRTVTIKFIGESKSLTGAIGTAEGKLSGFESKLGGIAKTAAGFAIGGGLLQLPGLLLDGAKGAAEDEAAMDRLKKAVENTGKSYDAMAPAVEDAIKRGQELAFTDGETAAALGTLTSLTGDSDEAMRRLGPAMDLARGAGISLEQAAKLLGKTSDENTTALSRLGIQVGENATAQDVLNAVDEKFKGQAGVFAESSAGQLAIAGQQASELAETFGGLLIPVISLLAAGLLAVVDAVNTHVVPALQILIDALAPVVTTIAGFVADNLGPIIAGLTAIGAAIFVSVLPALIAWVAGMIPVIASHVAMAAAVVVAYAPIIAIMVAVGVAAALLYKAWQENLFGIQDITKQVIDFIVPYMQSAWQAIQTVVETVFPIIQGVIEFYVTAWRTIIETALGVILGVFQTVFPIIQSVVETVFPIIATVVTTAIGTVQSVIETAIGAIQAIWGPFWDGFKAVVDTIFNGSNGVVRLVSGGVASVQSAISTAADGITGAWQAIWNTITGAVATARDVILGIVGGIISVVNGVINQINGAIGRINSALEFTVGGFDPPGPGPEIPGFTVNPPDIPTIGLIGGGGGAESFNVKSGGGGASPSGNAALAAMGTGAAASPNPLDSLPHGTPGMGGGMGAGMRRLVIYVAESDAAAFINGTMTVQAELRPV